MTPSDASWQAEGLSMREFMNQNPAATGLILRLEVRTHLCPRQHALRQRQHLPRILRGCSLQAEVHMLVSNSMILTGNLILSICCDGLLRHCRVSSDKTIEVQFDHNFMVQHRA